MDTTALAAMIEDAPAARSALLLAMPAACAGAALAMAVLRPSVPAAWTIVRIASAAALAAAVLSFGTFIMAGAAVLPTASSAPLRVDTAGAVALLLVAFVGWVIAGYSRRCLEGEPGQVRYAGWLMATLAGVGGVVLANDLLALAACWMLASASLQRLLLFHGERPAARIAAHKKRVANRLSELCLFAAIGILWSTLGTLRIDAILAHPALADPAGVGAAVQVAMVLVVLAALLKCALLPFHGWLIQVMEAPTPVSALLHAGVVNLGGFVLIRLGGLLDAVPAAQALLVVAGTATAVLAALVMTTRISIKVSLAWSTCAQMGFMLMQVGLGAYAMALLHLVAHSLYKAHAFLSAGDGVQRTAALALANRPAPEGMARALAAALGAAALMAAAQYAWASLFDLPSAIDPVQWALAAVACIVLAPLLAGPARGVLAQPVLLLSACAVALVHAGLHASGSAWLPARPDEGSLLPWFLAAIVLCAFAALYLLQAAIRSSPRGALARRLHPWFYAGLFLDERVTQAGFAAWPLHDTRSRT
ncbi:MAG: NADH-quinone oxidoreductase subunit L [Betaproteobacteria bacterium]|nr:NADH-quinone oxidoreductase subunit L [Betaproteobacteria bacterium]